MSQFRKKPVVIEAITWQEFIYYGATHATSFGPNGIPWSFNYNGHPITHERDDAYVIPTLEGAHFMTPDDMLITGVAGEIYPCKRDIFDQTYEPA